MNKTSVSPGFLLAKGSIITSTLAAMLFSASAFAQSQLPDVSDVGIQEVKSWASERIEEAESNFSNTGLSREESPGYWGNELVYQVFVDRFNNGDPSNDNANLHGSQSFYQDGPNSWEVHEWRHGGDIQGIIDRLDYIVDLGMTSIWITPVFKHRGTYHGYCTTDFTQIDPGFGTNELFREFVQEAHARNIKVILDVVLNHMCDDNTTYSLEPAHEECADDLHAKNLNGSNGGSNNQGILDFSSNFFSPLKSQYFFNRCGANTVDETGGTDPVSVFGDFTADMYDFDTRNHDFQKIFTDLHKYWIAYADIDGFRLDAAKHVTEDFVAYFSTEVRDYAKSIGKNNFYIVGEVAGPAEWIGRRLGNMFHNPENPNKHGNVPVTLTNRILDLQSKYLSHGLQNFPGLTASFDFAFSGRSREMLKGESWVSNISNHFSDVFYETVTSQADPRLSLTMLEIHDWPRFVNGPNINNTRLSEFGLSYLATTQGIPITHYGQEQGFNGHCIPESINAGSASDDVASECEGPDHAMFRQDMFISGEWRLGSTVPAINDMAYIGPTQASASPNWEDDPFLNRDHSVYQTARRFNYIRRSCDALRMGTIFPRLAENKSTGLLAFSRMHNNKEILVVVNNAADALEIPNIIVDSNINNIAGQRYANLLNIHEKGTVTKSELATTLNFNGLRIAGNTVKVFVVESEIAPWNEYLGTHQCSDNPRGDEFENVAPTAEAGDDIYINPGESAFFDGTQSIDSDGTITTYSWSNGLNTAAGSQVYDTEGDYEVTLTVTDNDDESASDTVTVYVRPNQPPVANAGNDISAVVGELVIFDASGSTDSDGTVVGYEWSEGLGNQARVTRTFDDPGHYTFSVTVTDDDGASATDSLDLVITEVPLLRNYENVYLRGSHNDFSLSTPMALIDDHLWQATAIYTGDASDRFKFDASGDWGINFGGGGGPSGTAVQDGADIYVGNISGTYLIHFNDDTLEWTKELLNETPYPPEANAGADQTVKVGSTVTLDAGLSSDPNNDIASYQWDNGFGNGVRVSQTMNQAGTYTVTLTVTDAEGFDDTDTVLINVVDNLPPTAVAGADTLTRVDESITLDGSSSFDNDGNIISYRWESDAFATVDNEQAVVTFGEPGFYTATLTVTDNDGATHSDDIIIEVEEVTDNWQRTIILIYGRTEVSQDMFIRGGIDAPHSNATRGTNCSSQQGGEHNIGCSIGIRHLNEVHQYTSGWRENDTYLDWGGLTPERTGREIGQDGTNNVGERAVGTPAIWTTNNCGVDGVVDQHDLDSSCHFKPSVKGGGYTELNTYGEHYWMLDVEMNCDDTINGWFEFKSFISNGPGWETNINQTSFGGLEGPGYSSGNHFGACGKINVFRRNQNNPEAIKEFEQE